MANAQSDYPSDEFDGYVGQNGGAHRGERTMFARVKPFIVAIVVALLCALMFLTWTNGWLGQHDSRSPQRTSATSQIVQKSQNEKKNSDKSQASETKSDEKKSDETKTDSSATTQPAQPTVTPAPVEPDKTLPVAVLNGTNRRGYAAENVKSLSDAGYTSATAGNYGAVAQPTVSSVWYSDDSDKTTAEDIARTLGISAVQKVDTPLKAKIEVILR